MGANIGTAGKSCFYFDYTAGSTTDTCGKTCNCADETTCNVQRTCFWTGTQCVKQVASSTSTCGCACTGVHACVPAFFVRQSWF